MRVLALATLAIAVGALCGCGADSDDLSGLAADTAAAKIDDGEVFSLAGSLRTNEPNCTKNPFSLPANRSRISAESTS
jgi:hypothetical protein